MKRIFWPFTMSLLLCLGVSSSGWAQVPAFPGAEGFGALSQGGRGGKVIEVTNLNNSGPGSLRAAIAASGKRTVVFRVGGTINLNQVAIDVVNPYLTIAGQTAPGGGIALRNGDVKIRTNDVVIRYVRFRPGETPNYGNSGVSHCIFIRDGARNVVIDHCSLTWATDENLTIYSAGGKIDNISVQNSIIAEGIRKQGGGSNTHAAGPTIGGVKGSASNTTDISIHRNLLSHNQFRNPYMKNKNGEVINNLIFDWEYWGMMFRGGITIDIIGNKFKRGKSFLNADWTTDRGIRYTPSDNNNGNFGVPGNPSIYFKGNVDNYFVNPSSNNWKMIQRTSPVFENPGQLSESFRRNTRQSLSWPVTVYPINKVEQDLLPMMGASGRLTAEGKLVPNLDPVDQRIIKKYQTSTSGQIGGPAEVGGWPALAKGTPYPDADKDGMSDTWEVAQGLNPNNPSDRNGDLDGDGFTNLEEFLNGSAEPEEPEEEGDRINLPGTVQVEDFNPGGQGVAYNDADSSNNGGKYRRDEGVDIQSTSDDGGGFNIGWTGPGEWLEYDVTVAQSALYDLGVRHASPSATGKVALSVDGNPAGDAISLPPTGGWQTWQTTGGQVFLEAGNHTIRLNILASSFNLNYLEFSVAPIASTFKFVTPGTEIPLGEPLPVEILASNPEVVNNIKLFLDGALVRQENLAPYEWGNVQSTDPELFSLAAGAHQLGVLITGKNGAKRTLTTTVTVRSTAETSLPVTLLNFDTQIDDRQAVQLHWLTSEETNNRGFHIQHTTDVNGAFQTIGFVEAAGASVPYRFVHSTPAGGMNYYRLAQEDEDGATNLSVIRSVRVQDDVAAPTVLLIPNPSSDLVSLTGIDFDEPVTVSVFDLNGRRVKQVPTSRFSVSDLPGGTYLVEVLNGKLVERLKLVVNR